MAGARVQVNKAHKTRFASKSSRNIHKTSLQQKNKISKSDRNVAKGARNARMQRNKMVIVSAHIYLPAYMIPECQFLLISSFCFFVFFG